MIKFYNLGMDCYVQSVPCIAPAVGAALIAGGAGLFSSLIGSSTQLSANKDYLKGIRETNQANKELYEKQMNDVRQNYAIEKSNDTPAMQLARLRQAGINSSSSITGDTGQSIQSVTASPHQAPDQTPNPFGNMNLGGIAKDAIAAYQSGQQISDTQMSLYEHGVRSAIYYEQQINQLNGQILDNINKDNRNKMDEENLSILIHQRNTMVKEFQSHMRQADDLHNESLEKQRLIGRQIWQIEAEAKIKKYMAETERMMARTEAKRVKDAMYIAHDQREQSWLEFKRSGELHRLEKVIKSFDGKQKEYAAEILYNQAIQAGWTTDSDFNEAMKRLFGFNIHEIISGSFKLNP